jgi:hypothetical protein
MWWSMVNGEWSMVNGQWLAIFEINQRSCATKNLLPIADCRLPIADCRLISLRFIYYSRE